jgi:hypothetical protein
MIIIYFLLFFFILCWIIGVSINYLDHIAEHENTKTRRLIAIHSNTLCNNLYCPCECQRKHKETENWKMTKT